ncbi:hypothetical protein A2686_00345 [Candidatus Woesebacteria bacterium RIFCSPHIGHO2_01_FULL_38_10]|uniref:Uncharacterized protein n=1 Tax=Candidatus Woesebacteria bacterium RIFCSPLOWO2_01_FULL_39_10b TaxID=1802517 RepID=A0A1F8BA02_9BACT|nr:MAG: hypothetical protein A2686_00345 [Candidatus Woesebacteria bacterium RIFCSPHIGHO2_01_FULL_38_10]OGM60872.1 MAG: hypothetical protein A2892_04425 [Candidatus Woesebacteria bacterium RIFCSPLOWO2_01_FULL_39_10b]
MTGTKILRNKNLHPLDDYFYFQRIASLRAQLAGIHPNVCPTPEAQMVERRATDDWLRNEIHPNKEILKNNREVLG